MTGEVIFDLVLFALSVEYARQNLGQMRPFADFRVFLDDEEIPPPFLGPHREVDSRLDAEGLREAHGGQGGQHPGIAFSQWNRWKERSSLDNVDLPGVYLLAHFQTAPDGPADPTDKQIIYIGATDRPLTERWRDFDRVISGKTDNHSGAKTYRKLFGHRIDDLYVAALPVGLGRKFSWWFSQYVEAKLLWEFVWQWASPPPCNRG